MAQYKIIPIKLKDANIFVAQNHRHNKPVDHRSHRFSLGLLNGEELIGVAIAGLPIARKQDDGKTLEIMRVCVKEGNPNANSMLYGRVRRIAGLMGYERIITYTLQSESASSLKGVGAVKEAEINRPSKWSRPARPRIEQNVYKEKKVRWNLPPLNQPTAPSPSQENDRSPEPEEAKRV